MTTYPHCWTGSQDRENQTTGMAHLAVGPTPNRRLLGVETRPANPFCRPTRRQGRTNKIIPTRSGRYLSGPSVLTVTHQYVDEVGQILRTSGQPRRKDFAISRTTKQRFVTLGVPKSPCKGSRSVHTVSTRQFAGLRTPLDGFEYLPCVRRRSDPSAGRTRAPA